MNLWSQVKMYIKNLVYQQDKLAKKIDRKSIFEPFLSINFLPASVGKAGKQRSSELLVCQKSTQKTEQLFDKKAPF